MSHIDPHKDISEREAEDERELIRVAITRLNELRRHSHEVSLIVVQCLIFRAVGSISDEYLLSCYPYSYPGVFAQSQELTDHKFH